jgi:hypothetical protein
MFNSIFILRPLMKPFIVWRNPKPAAITGKVKGWTARQLYLEGKGDQTQHKVLELAVREVQRTQSFAQRC